MNLFNRKSTKKAPAPVPNKKFADPSSSTIRAEHRLRPIVQLIRGSDPAAEMAFSACAWQSFRMNKSIRDICIDLQNYAESVGYRATVGAREMSSDNMPSFPGMRVTALVLLVDLDDNFPTWN